jgi:hypothetical protein
LAATNGAEEVALNIRGLAGRPRLIAATVSNADAEGFVINASEAGFEVSKLTPSA